MPAASSRNVRGGRIIPAGALVRSCHPEPTAAVTAVATALALATGRDLPGLVAVGAAVLAGQLSIGWANDLIDRDRDRYSDRTDKPVAAGRVSARTVTVAASTAAACCIPLSFLSGLWAGVAHLVAVAAGLSYDLGLKSTPLSPLPYVVAFGLLPCFVVLGLPGSTGVPGWLVVAGALLGGGAHFANVNPDLDDDMRTGVRGLPHRIPRAAVPVVAAVLLLTASACITLGPRGPVSAVGITGFAASVLILGGTCLWAPTRPSPAGRDAIAFRAVLVVALIDVALLVAGGARIG